MSKRKIFDELMEGVAAMKSHLWQNHPPHLSGGSGTASFESTNEPWKNGNRVALSQILKPQRSSFWFASTPTPSNDWNEWP